MSLITLAANASTVDCVGLVFCGAVGFTVFAAVGFADFVVFVVFVVFLVAFLLFFAPSCINA